MDFLANPRFGLKGLPTPLPATASRKDLYEQNTVLFEILAAARDQLIRSYAQMQVMDAENGRLRLRAFSRTKKHRQFVNSAHARHMTSQEALEELAHAEWKATMKELFKEAATH